MPWTALDSSHIKAIDYNDENRTLKIQFQSGRVYDYYEVDPRHVDALLTEESSGGYFAKHIKPHHSVKQTG